ncbi:hypothetical protein [uncultured virus]|uniref:Uncharacterized protein n=1 Tax=uncultured virus TaxID=340016 RepID=A0A218MNF7_9VIRU|nr:hypothetical protein [uncultured virus]
MFNEEMLEMVTTSIKVLDALYESELDFDECIDVLNVLVSSFEFGEAVGNEFNKESFKTLKDSMQKDVNDHEKLKENK